MPSSPLISKLQAIRESSVRVGLLREAIVELPAPVLIDLVANLVELCLKGAPPGEDALLAFIPAFFEQAIKKEGYEAISEAYALAKRRMGADEQGLNTIELDEDPLESDLEAAAASNGSTSPSPAGLAEDEMGSARPKPPAVTINLVSHVEMSDEHLVRRAKVASLMMLSLPPHKAAPRRTIRFGPKWEKEVSLGARKALASGAQRHFLERLIYDADVQVVERLCANPRIVEKDILLIATRRPIKADLLNAIARSHWLTRYKVRHALALNPYTESGLVLRLLPLLHERDLKALCFVGEVHPVVRDYAKLLVELKESFSRGRA